MHTDAVGLHMHNRQRCHPCVHSEMRHLIECGEFSVAFTVTEQVITAPNTDCVLEQLDI